MLKLTLDMLIRKRRGMVISVVAMALSIFLVLYELTTFHRLIDRTTAVIKEMKEVDIWVVDKSLRSLDHPNSIDGALEHIKELRSFSGFSDVAGFSSTRVKTKGGFEYIVIGLDETSFLGAPENLRMGKIKNLLFDGGVIIDEESARGAFSYTSRGQRISAGLGAHLQIGEGEVTVVGVAATNESHHKTPVVYTTLARAPKIASRSDEGISFILIKASPGTSIGKLCTKIEKTTGLKAFSRGDFTKFILKNFLKEHHIPQNLSSVIVFGFLISLGILGVIISSVCDSLSFDLHVFKAIGASRFNIHLMMLVMVVAVTFIGWLFGLVLYGLLYLLFLKTGLIFAISLESFFVSLGAVILTAISVAFYKGTRIKELLREVV